MIYIEKGIKKDRSDPLSENLKKDIEILGIRGVESVSRNDVFWIEGDFCGEEIKQFVEKIIVDPVIEEYSIDKPLEEGDKSLLISYKPGVYDAEAETLKEIAHDTDYKVKTAKTGKKYIFEGDVDDREIDEIKERLLMNGLIEFEVKSMEFPSPDEYRFRKETVDILDADEEKLKEISRKWMLALNLSEMKKIKAYFESAGRNPTDLELETIAQTWSEHCFHKTFKSPLDIKGDLDFPTETLFGTIKKATGEINDKRVLLAFSDNAGAIEFDENYAITYKVETHNHPSALEPYGGAETGVGGVIRDTMGAGLGARPFASTDIFCFGDIDADIEDIPEGVLHPRRVMRGVVAGVRDYGNRMGIPTVGGSVHFDREFTYNPLIYVGSVGIIKREHLNKKVKPGDLIVVVGGKTGRDGIHGATFSSLSLDEESQVMSGGAVQIGNPIEEKKMLDVLMRAKEENLYRSITDCGAGGFSSAVGEMGRNTGAVVELENVRLKYKGLSYREIWISESQERMVLAVPPENKERLKEVFDEENVGYSIIGKFGGKKLTVKYGGEVVGDIEPEFLFEEIPLLERKAVIRKVEEEPPYFERPENLNEVLKELISSPNTGSRDWIIKQYDHEVQAGSVIKASSGNRSPSDGVVLRPVFDSSRAVVLGFGINPSYGKYDSYRMGASAVDEAIRNLISAGGDIEKTALLDNFCFGDVEDEIVMGDLVAATKACYDYALAFKTPFISGKDSLNNYFSLVQENISIPPTLLISSISVIEDFRHSMTSNFKEEDNFIYLIGSTKNELGGSEYGEFTGTGGVVPGVDRKIAPDIYEKMSEGIRKKLFEAVHDVSSGGLGVAVSEMTFSNFIGCRISLDGFGGKLRDDIKLFSESNSRFIVEVKEKNVSRMKSIFKAVPIYELGKTGGTSVEIESGGDIVIDLSLKELYKRWKEAVNW